ncbi:MAG: 4-alpha-glucanotransferase [Chryseobacterium sp.]|nr:MAG: 4-alpha-glucanotransferase [Chryseobacterium sp.]
MRINFNINYHTAFGENIAVEITNKADGETFLLALRYGSIDRWHLSAELPMQDFVYRYGVTDINGNVLREEIPYHHLEVPNGYKEISVFDVWNKKNFPENYLTNKIQRINLAERRYSAPTLAPDSTHVFKMQVPLYDPGDKLYLIGNLPELGAWDLTKALEMAPTSPSDWQVSVKLPADTLAEYKYIVRRGDGDMVYESGNNRVMMPLPVKSGALNVIHDHYFKFPAELLWRAGGVAIPVFSLRSEKGYGIGEFSDLMLLADWAQEAGLQVLQVLPINDTTANYTWTDSYPYAAISVYALHPIYLSIDRLDFPLTGEDPEEYKQQRTLLNQLETVDYENVIVDKWKYVRKIFAANKDEILADRDFKTFIDKNADWLKPYTTFCMLRDQYQTAEFSSWRILPHYKKERAEIVFRPDNPRFADAMVHCWVQYQLDKQLKAAVDYAHSKNIVLKGDLPIGVYRHSVEAWTEPELFGMDFQAGAPPDEFTDLGQNWGFPTYNWEVMKKDGYRWWKRRFASLEQYFDALRIDHILGFFRIWRMPMSAVQGILGYFYPAVPVTIQEFHDRGIPFRSDRYCKPYLTEPILRAELGEHFEAAVQKFFEPTFDEHYQFAADFNTQRKIVDHFIRFPEESGLQDRLLSLAANVLFILEETEFGQVYHPRFNQFKTSSYHSLPDGEKAKLYDQYIDYFYRRQDGLWRNSAMEKLPVLLASTDMLICGEDLGLVPDSVPQVMDELGITALKVQRSPKEDVPFYNPAHAGYLNVVTVSSHDSSTLRQWWHEDRALIQDYYNRQLGCNGIAPENLSPELAEVILQQHLHTDAMLAIFPIQEFLATDERLRREDADAERINIPAVFPHYWRYRMHLPLEELIGEKDFNAKIKGWMEASGRI